MNEPKDYSGNNKKLLEVIEKLSNYYENKDDYNSFLQMFHSLYDGEWRHQYSEITRYFLKLNPNSLNEKLAQTLSNLSYLHVQLEKEISEIPEHDEVRLKSCQRCRRNLEKLFDHINLESVRLDYNKSLQDQMAKNIDQMRLLKSQIARSKKILTAVDEKMESVDERVKVVNEKFDNQQIQSVTVLGIFASVVLSFIGAFSLSASIFSNMALVSTPKLYFLSVIIIAFVSNILSYLFYFLRSMQDKSVKYNWKIWAPFNIFLFAISICILVIPSYFCDFI